MLNTSRHPGFSQWCFTIAAECFSLVSLVPRGTYRSLCSAPRQIGDAVLDPSRFAGTRRTWKGPERTTKNRRWMRPHKEHKEHMLFLWPHSPPVLSLFGFLHCHEGNDSSHLFQQVHRTLWCPPTTTHCCQWVLGVSPPALFHVTNRGPCFTCTSGKKYNSSDSCTKHCFTLSFMLPWAVLTTLGMLQVLWQLWNSSKIIQNREQPCWTPMSLYTPLTVPYKYYHHVQNCLQACDNLPVLKQQKGSSLIISLPFNIRLLC